jgi:uncharacterized protein YbcC (UPF0753/DUF2309 family)
MELALVLFIGHGSTLQIIGSSLDCGACAASPGRHNARMLTKNIPSASSLEENHNIEIPIVPFLEEHNTTTDEILLFDSEIQTLIKPIAKS